MPIDFPNNPISGQTYSYGINRWIYNGVAWDKLDNHPGICGGNQISINYAEGLNGATFTVNVVEGHGSGLDADLLDGVSGERFIENLQTGILYGGLVSINAGNTATFDVSAGAGIIVNIGGSTTGYPTPTLTNVSWTAKTGVTTGYLGSTEETFISINSSGNLVLQSTAWSEAQYESQIPIGTLFHHGTGYIDLAISIPHVSYGQAQQFDPFIRAFGPLKLNGYELTGSTADFKIYKSSGKAYLMGRNYAVDPNNPNVVTDTASNPVQYYYMFYRDGSGGFDTTILTTGTDVTNYDDGTGILNSAPSGKYTTQRIFGLPNQPNVLGIYYGREIYNSLEDAKANIQYETFSESEATSTQGVFLGYLVCKANATNLGTTGDHEFIASGLFRNTSNIGGGGLAFSALTDLSDVNISSPSNNQALIYDSSTSAWVNKSFSDLPVVTSFNGLTGAVTGVTTGISNTFGPLQSFTNGISAAGGTFSSQARFLSGITVAGGATFATDISVNGMRVGLGAGNQLYNVALGAFTLTTNTIGNYNLAIGASSLELNIDGTDNIALGQGSLNLNTSGSNNVGVGSSTLFSNTTGSNNSAIGVASLGNISTGNDNVGIGFYSLGAISSGRSQNTAIGSLAGFYRGSASSINFGGTGNIYIGYESRASASTQTNEIVIGTRAVGLGSNTAVIGATAQTAATIYGLLNAPGGISAAGATFSGLARFNAGISAAGATLSSNITIPSGSTLTVSGNFVANGNVNLGDATTDSITVAGLLSANSGISAAGCTFYGAANFFANPPTNPISLDAANGKITVGGFGRSLSLSFPQPGPAQTPTCSLPTVETVLAGLSAAQTFTNTNTFNTLTNFPGGISAAGGTFSGHIRFLEGFTAGARAGNCFMSFNPASSANNGGLWIQNGNLQLSGSAFGIGNGSFNFSPNSEVFSLFGQQYINQSFNYQAARSVLRLNAAPTQSVPIFAAYKQTVEGTALTATYTATNMVAGIDNNGALFSSVGLSAAGGTFASNVQAATYTETSNQIRVTNNARSWFL